MRPGHWRSKAVAVKRTIGGETYYLDPEIGNYRPLSRQEAVMENASPVETFGRGAGRALLDTISLPYQMAAQVRGYDMQRDPLGNFIQQQHMGAEQAAVAQPYATGLGEYGAPLIAGGPGLVGAGVRGATRMAGRVAGAIRGALPEASVGETVGLIRRGAQLGDAAWQTINAPMRKAAFNVGASAAEARSVGAAQANLAAGLPQACRGPLETMVAELIDPVPMSADQQAAAIWGRQRVFEQLPGMADGLTMLRAGAESDPLLAGALKPIIRSNQLKFDENLGREGFGLQDMGRRGFSRSTLGEIRDRQLRPVFQEVESTLDKAGGLLLPEQMRTDVQMFIPKRTAELLGLNLEEPLSGAQAMELRSTLWKQADSLSAPGTGRVAEGGAARALVHQIEGLIGDKLGNPALVQRWHQAGNRYRLLMALEKPGVVAKNGQISLPKFANVLKREYPDEYLRMREGPRAALDPGIRNVLNDVEYFDTFGNTIGDSGTATRSSIMQMVQHPGSIIPRLWLRDALEGYVSKLNPPSGPTP